MNSPDSVERVVEDMRRADLGDPAFEGQIVCVNSSSVRAWATRLQALDRQRQEDGPVPLTEWQQLTAALTEARKALQAWADWEDGLVSGMADRRDKAMCLTRIFLTRTAKE